MTTAHDSSNPTLHDLVLAQDPSGAPAKIVEALKKRCPILDYVTFVQGNLETGHRVTTETAIPSIGYRAFNECVETCKLTSGQFDEVCGLMEGHSQLDVKLAELNGNGAAYRSAADMRFLRAFKLPRGVIVDKPLVLTRMESVLMRRRFEKRLRWVVPR